MKTKFFTLILCIAVLLTLFAGCEKPAVVMTYGDSEITLNMYRYWLSTYKGSFMYAYSDMSDTDEFWDTVLYDQVTAEEYLNQSVIDNVKRTLICMELCKQYRLTLSDAAIEQIDSYIDELIYERADGSRTVFNQELSKFGVNASILREIYIAEDQAALAFQYLYGESGPLALTEEDLDQYCADNYVHVQHIYVNNAYVYDTDENGEYLRNSDGELILRTLTDEEAAEQNEKIEAIRSALSSGESFDTVYRQYSEDLYYENGYYISRSMNFIDEVIDASFSLNIGEYICVTSDYGTHFIKRLEMDTQPYKDNSNADFFEDYENTVKTALFYQYLEERLDDVSVDLDSILPYSIRDAVVNYSI